MIKQRIVQIAEYYNIAKEKFFCELGVSSANFRGNAAKTPVNSNIIANIFTMYPDISPDWLILGKGEMLRTNTQSNANQASSEPIAFAIIKRNEELIRENALLQAEIERLKKSNTHAGPRD